MSTKTNTIRLRKAVAHIHNSGDVEQQYGSVCDADETRILHDLVLKELKLALEVVPANVRTLTELREHATRDNLKYWQKLFELEEKLFETVTR